MSAAMPSSAIERAVALAVEKTRGEPGPLLEILHAVQAQLGCVPPESVPLIADALNLSRAEVHGVISFYHHFREKPRGTRLHLQVCQAEACLAMGAAEVARQCRDIFGAGIGEMRADGKVSVEAVYCLGLCACAPSVLANGEPEGRVDAQSLDYLSNRHLGTR